ncbi:SubName: Full=Uncharacterized protein {ECO:0000313/EMBL:CCA73470.1} [Serendipita indica DSM 11827]|nr:SubName: Full=Uncharacterized protein {ECO:0000313/EMBL:CCA73470.1} [Serendipita indica DSM 11827]
MNAYPSSSSSISKEAHECQSHEEEEDLQLTPTAKHVQSGSEATCHEDNAESGEAQNDDEMREKKDEIDGETDKPAQGNTNSLKKAETSAPTLDTDRMARDYSEEHARDVEYETAITDAFYKLMATGLSWSKTGTQAILNAQLDELHKSMNRIRSIELEQEERRVKLEKAYASFKQVVDSLL